MRGCHVGEVKWVGECEGGKGEGDRVGECEGGKGDRMGECEAGRVIRECFKCAR